MLLLGDFVMQRDISLELPLEERELVLCNLEGPIFPCTSFMPSHAGIEMSPWPYPELQSFYRSLIDSGADIVHGHHSHLPQGYEAYGRGLILYGMGNFAAEDEEYLDSYYGLHSLAVRLIFRVDEFDWELLPLKMNFPEEDETMGIFPLQGEELRGFLDGHLRRCSSPLKEAEFLKSLWQEVAIRYFRTYGDSLWGRNQGNPLKRFLKKILYPKREVQQEYILRYLLYACESHRQMMKTALGVLCGVDEDVRTLKSSAWVDEMIPSTAKGVSETA